MVVLEANEAILEAETGVFEGLIEKFKAFWSPVSMLGVVASFTGDNFLNECYKYIGSKNADSLATSHSGVAGSSDESTILPYSGDIGEPKQSYVLVSQNHHPLCVTSLF